LKYNCLLDFSFVCWCSIYLAAWVDGDFLYYMADAAAVAVIHMIVAIFLMHCNSLY
jgi:hypothetical protein